MIEKFNSGIESQAYQDKEFVRKLLHLLSGLNATLRWRNGEQAAFLTQEQIQSMDEDLLGHAGGMTTIAEWLFEKAEHEADDSVTSLDFRKIVKHIVHHDAEEVIIGDARSKDDTYYKLEEAARDKLSDTIDDLN